MRAAFRVDFGGAVGFGHLARSIALARGFRRAGHEVIFFSRVPSDFAENPIYRGLNSGQLEVIPLQPLTPLVANQESETSQASSKVDAHETKTCFLRHKADLLVVDSYGFSSSWVNHWQGQGPILTISDKPAPLGVDAVLDYGFDSSKSKHSIFDGGNPRGLLGPDFALVSDEFSTFSAAPTKNSNESKTGLISLGGAAPQSVWNRVIPAVLEIFDDSNLLLSESQIGKLVTTQILNSRLEIRAQNSGLAAFFETSDFAIVNAGVTMYEMAASGKPGIALVTADNQRPALEAGVAGSLVAGGEIAHLNQLISNLKVEIESANSTPLLSWLRGRSLVDHLGPDRVVVALGYSSDRTGVLREAQESDLPFLLRLANEKSTRSASFNQSPITPSQHFSWFTSSLQSERRIWIYERGGASVGQCRLDSTSEGFELDFSILESCRGMGFGSTMLRLLIEVIGTSRRIVANVKPQNLGSAKTLMRVGFKSVGTSQNNAIFEWSN